jgi:hypothetical protein
MSTPAILGLAILGLVPDFIPKPTSPVKIGEVVQRFPVFAWNAMVNPLAGDAAMLG